MSPEDNIGLPPDISLEYVSFEEFCSENIGRELLYLGLVEENPLDMDTITIAFSIRHLVRLSKPLRDKLLECAVTEEQPGVKALLALKGIELDKNQAQALRTIIFAYRDSGDEEIENRLVRALQLLAVSRERERVILNAGETYRPPDEGWSEEDFDGDEYGLATVRSIEDSDWRRSEES